MRSHVRLVVPLLLVALATCNGNVIGFDISQTISQQVIPGDPVAHANAVAFTSGTDDGLMLEWVATPPTVDTQGATRLDLRSLQLDITSMNERPDETDCWEFLYSAVVSIESTLNGSALARAEVASVTHPGCVPNLVFTTTPGLDLMPYAREGYRLVIDVDGIPPAHDVSFNGRVVLRAGVL